MGSYLDIHSVPGVNVRAPEEEDQVQWVFHNIEPNKIQLKKLSGACVEIAINTVKQKLSL